MVSHFERREKRTFSASSILGTIALVIILIIVGFLIFSNIEIKQKKDKLDKQIAAIKKEIEDLQSKNADLKEGISRVNEEEYIEKVAREELNLQKEGEKVVGFILPPEREGGAQEKSFWQPKNWWGWFREKIKNIF